MITEKRFVQFGNMRLEANQIQAYQIVQGTEIIKTTRIVNINPCSEEGKKLLADFKSGATDRAIGAGIVHGTAGAVGGTVVGLTAYFAINAMTGGAALLLGGAIAAGNTVLGVKKSLKKSKEKEKDLLKKNEEKEVDASVLQIILKNAEEVEVTDGYTGYSTANYATGATKLTKKRSKNRETLQFQVNKCGFDIYEKCKELDILFGITAE